MCDLFWQRSMDNNDHQGGDLSDIIRSVNPNNSSSSTAAVLDFHINPAASFEELPAEDLIAGNPFGLRDPLLNELTGTSFYESWSDDKSQSNNDGGDDKSSSSNNKISIGDKEMKRPCNLFSRVLQISPTKHPVLSPWAIKPLSSVDMVKVDHGQIQISSPRPPGIKRRKSQAKKVVCIPAPAAASSRPSGEVVPSDLWAWRKYGQKPIKGSPYPRGYYRCSSSKGCSARKQVERNRTDPNMLVITYTSEHNHPWPTQRNALAGSTRSQPSKNSKASLMKEDWSNSKENNIATSSSSLLAINVKEEVKFEDQMDKATVEAEPAMASDYVFNQFDDFFADLAELESDPMSLIFARPDEEVSKEGNKGLDPFINMFDWGVSSYGDDQAKKELS